MENPKMCSSSSSISAFYPSEDHLLRIYLPHKNRNNRLSPSSLSISNPNSFDAIKELNLYNFNPFDLPEVNCFRFGYKGRKRHWYCYTERINCEDEGNEKRRAGFGFWKRKGRVKDVVGNGGKVILGRRKKFAFHLEKSNGKFAVKTKWNMYEYSLIDNFKARFVLCRIFAKSQCRNSISDRALSSCAEESVPSIRHIGIQHDGSTMSFMGQDGVHDHDSVYEGNAANGMSTRLLEEAWAHNVVTSPCRAGSSNILADSFSPSDLSCILEGDFIELDDLV